MKNFVDWVKEEKKEDLSLILEKTKRAGIAHWAYPKGYVKSQYPGEYFVPIAADAIQKMGSTNPD